jgi:drug/metabolite transporter (DMT)-like permease
MVMKKAADTPAIANSDRTNPRSNKISKDYVKAALLALLVTVLWASSWVIIKFGLQELPPLTFAGLRYFLAAMVLMTAVLSRDTPRSILRNISSRDFAVLAGYGLIFVTITQGAQFVGLDLLEAIAVSLLLNMTPLLVLVIGIVALKEVPSPKQIGLILVGILGVLVYFYPLDLGVLQTVGLLVVLAGVIANAFSSIIGRAINRQKTFPPLIVTAVSMLVGSTVLLAAGLAFERIQSISLLSVLYIIWLSIVNTAIAFTLWNKAMQTLRAVDISIINGTMLPQIVVLSIVFLGEMPDLLDWLGLVLIALSALAIQILQARKNNQQVN